MMNSTIGIWYDRGAQEIIIKGTIVKTEFSSSGIITVAAVGLTISLAYKWSRYE